MSWFADSQVPEREPLLAAVRAAIDGWPAPTNPPRLAVAFSGGVDSSVLLATLQRLRPRGELRALHVDHGLHADSSAWAERCAAAAAALGVPFKSRRVAVDRDSPGGLESAAREARYAALAEELAPAEVLLTAHHADDQLETVLLRLSRGAGVRGMRGIRGFAPFGRGYLGRPLLNVTRAEVRAQAIAWQLDWLEDPANADARHDRNFLRLHVVPRLAERWPAAARSAARLAEQMADAEEILAAMAAQDAGAADDAGRLPRAALAALDPARQRNLLRHLVREAGLPVPGAEKLEELRGSLLGAQPDSHAVVAWPGAEGRVFHARLYLMATLPESSAPAYCALLGKHSEWSGPEGHLRFEPSPGGPGLPESWLDAGLELKFRAGGEQFHPLDRERERPLKDWLQQAAIVPWMRGRMPLLFRRERLVAVADLWLGADVRAATRDEPVWRVLWTDHAPLL
jgi:tRNA(Ile)-lysidine synthase